MKKKLSVILAILMVVSVMIAGFTPALAGENGDHDQYRLSGTNRYQTAHEIAKENFETAETVILVRGDHIDGTPQIVDGLTASGLAGDLNAPILLTSQDRLRPDTLNALEDLEAKNVVIIGGFAAISQTVENELHQEGYFVQRVREDGGNRYSTAAAVAMEIGEAKDNTAIITSGSDANLVDSLVAGPLAHQGHPILLVNNARGTIPQETFDAIDALGIENLLIVGGTAAVSVEIEETLEAIEGVTVAQRFSGVEGSFQNTGRVGTSLHLANFEAFADFEGAYLVNGRNFVDAVAASTLGGPVVYFQDEVNDEAKGFLSEKQTFSVIGGTSTIPNAIVEQVIEARLDYVIDAFHTAAAKIVGEELSVDGTVYGKITAYDKNFNVTVGLADKGLIENADEIFDALMNIIEDLGVVEVTLNGHTFVLADTHGSEIVDVIGFEQASKLREEGITLSAFVDMKDAGYFTEDFHFDFDDL